MSIKKTSFRQKRFNLSGHDNPLYPTSGKKYRPTKRSRKLSKTLSCDKWISGDPNKIVARECDDVMK